MEAEAVLGDESWSEFEGESPIFYDLVLNVSLAKARVFHYLFISPLT